MKELKHLNKYLLKYKKKLLFGFFITIIARVFSLVAPRLIGNSLTAVEHFIKNNSRTDIVTLQKTLLINISIIIGTALISGFFTFLMRQAIINVSRYIEFDLKNEVFTQYQNLTQSFYKNNRTGDLMNRISEDVGKVRMYFGPAIMYSINTIALFFILISYMLSVAPKLTFYTLLPLPVLSFLIYKLNKAIHSRSTIVQEMLSKLSSFTQEIFTGINVIKSYNLSSTILSNFNDLSNITKEKNMSLVTLQAWFFPLMLLLIGVSNLIVILIGGSQYINGKIEIGVLAEFIIYVNMLTWPVTVVGWLTSIIQQAEASQKRINDFLKESPSIKDGNGSANVKNGEIEFRNVSLTYPETKIKALNNVSFKIKAGETIGVLGKVGAGKTSLLELITRLYDPNEGEVLIDGQNLKLFNLNELRKSIGYVPQNPFLFSESISNNIKFGKNNATNKEIENAANNASIDKEIKKLKNGYQTILGERGVTLSGGQVQRISIARALIKNPNIILLDDCLSAVDTDTEEIILKSLYKYSEKKTTLIVSHRISSMKSADSIIVFKNGNVIEQGGHNELIENESYYSRLYNKQQSEQNK
jgi:ATP-binding cassette subfamily B multidrug efflux pump